MDKRPLISFRRKKIEVVHDLICIIILLGIFINLAMKYPQLPEIVAIHFNGLGEPDGWGGKSGLLLVPILSAMLYLGLTVLSKYPHRFNYLREITMENAQKQYENARMMLSWMKVEIVALLGSVQWIAIQASTGAGAGLWALPVFFTVALLCTIIYYVIRSFRTM